jgi:hypothetical protein
MACASRAGYDKFGYDKEGYSKDKLDRFGFTKEGYDKEGYGKYTWTVLWSLVRTVYMHESAAFPGLGSTYIQFSYKYCSNGEYHASCMGVLKTPSTPSTCSTPPVQGSLYKIVSNGNGGEGVAAELLLGLCAFLQMLLAWTGRATTRKVLTTQASTSEH